MRSSTVSIRAPARGATGEQQVLAGGMMFQSAPPHGGRQETSARCGWRSGFNPRPRTGGDSRQRAPRWAASRFNPRPRTGGDPGLADSSATCSVSIRAPARGATWEWRRADRADVSIRAPARGATAPSPIWPPSRSFNPRPRTGGDRGRSKRPDELRLAWSLREPCMVVDVPHSCKTFVSSQHLDWDVVTARANLHART